MLLETPEVPFPHTQRDEALAAAAAAKLLAEDRVKQVWFNFADSSSVVGSVVEGGEHQRAREGRREQEREGESRRVRWAERDRGDRVWCADVRAAAVMILW